MFGDEETTRLQRERSSYRPAVTAEQAQFDAAAALVRRAESAEATLAAALKALDHATDYANGRWSEWGERAVEVAARLDKVRDLLRAEGGQ